MIGLYFSTKCSIQWIARLKKKIFDKNWYFLQIYLRWKPISLKTRPIGINLFSLCSRRSLKVCSYWKIRQKPNGYGINSFQAGQPLKIIKINVQKTVEKSNIKNNDLQLTIKVDTWKFSDKKCHIKTNEYAKKYENI